MSLRTLQSLSITLLVAVGSSADVAAQSARQPAAEPSSKTVMTSEVEWQQLNPARGDQSPKAGTLWGDRIGPGPAGFLLKPVDGFRSPPHIHNIAYRGVVISGLIHNDDPTAQDMWMPTGSFWTQPEGGVHITAARGNDALAYIEVEDGFGVLPAKDAFRSRDEPINVHTSNVVWLDASDTAWINPSETTAAADGPEIAFLWGKPQQDRLNGSFIKLPAGSEATLRSKGSTFRAVVIQGRSRYEGPGDANVKTMMPGSYFSSLEESMHQLACEAGSECVIYVRIKGKYDVVSGQARK